MKTRLRYSWTLAQWQLVLDAKRVAALVPLTRELLLHSMVLP